MKRSQLKRRTPLSPGKPMSRGSLTRKGVMKRKPAKKTDDPAYLARVRQLPCAAIGRWEVRMLCNSWYGEMHRCRGPVIAHHSLAHRRGQMKALDRNTIPLCNLGAHHQLHTLTGCFKGFTKDQRRDWERARVAETQAALGVGGEG